METAPKDGCTSKIALASGTDCSRTCRSSTACCSIDLSEACYTGWLGERRWIPCCYHRPPWTTHLWAAAFPTATFPTATFPAAVLSTLTFPPLLDRNAWLLSLYLIHFFQFYALLQPVLHHLISHIGLDFSLLELHGTLTYEHTRNGRPVKQYEITETDLEDVSDNEESDTVLLVETKQIDIKSPSTNIIYAALTDPDANGATHGLTIERLTRAEERMEVAISHCAAPKWKTWYNDRHVGRYYINDPEVVVDAIVHSIDRTSGREGERSCA